MRLHSLGSGSSGNAFLLQTDSGAILIDAGVAPRACAAALRPLLGVRPLDAIVVSHEHIDHVRAINSLLRRHDAPVVSTSGTRAAIQHERSWTRAVCGGRFATGDIEIDFVSVSHDAAEPCGFVVQAGGTRAAVFTDLGVISPQVLAALASADIVVLEANYDRLMLQRGGYPARLKRRIQGPAGHLSNDDCAGALVASVGERTRAVWLAHLSHNNNLPAIATTTVREALALRGVEVPVRALPRFEVAEVTAAPAAQLSLGF